MPRHPAIEPLEPRQLLAANGMNVKAGTAALQGPTLFVNGKGGSDKITLGLDPADLSILDVSINGRLFQFPAAAVQHISAAGRGGNDAIVISEGLGVLAINATLDGGGGNDMLTGGSGADSLIGGGGRDTLAGGNGDDLLNGGGGNDVIMAGNGNDNLLGGAGKDDLRGEAGDDTLDAGSGADILTGGDGNDVFVLRKGEANGDVINDFNGNGTGLGDSIVLEGYAAGTTFTRVGPGSSNIYQINDHGSIETVTIFATGQVHSGDWEIVTTYDFTFA